MKKALNILLITILLIPLTSCTIETNTAQTHLPTINTIKNLQQLIKNNKQHSKLELGRAEMPETSIEESDSTSQQYSDTNIQVQGIDEGDIVKTDGEHIYQISDRNIIITKAYPVEEAKVISKTELDKDVLPIELYIHKDKIIVLSYKNNNQDQNEPQNQTIMPGFHFYNNTIIQIYQNKDGKLTKEREIETEGNIVSTRKKDSSLYLVTTKHLNFYDLPEINPAPLYRDTVKNSENYQQKPLTEIPYFPKGDLSSFINIVALDIEKPKQQAQVETYLGNAQNIYMSHNNLYIALTTMDETQIHKFTVDGTKVQYHSLGVVPGYVLNQFAMDEHKGYFRIATTNYNTEEMTNNLYILDSDMQTVGKLENLAPTERIYSARFIGDKGYMVTFEIVDPLFVIDLSNPRSPKVLGELKIPGFSSYLHPIGENHLLGIGRDTTVSTQWGREVAIELGVKLAIFDVTDVNNPIEKHVEIIGGRGTYSEALHNHKSIHYHNDTLAFPISVTDPSNNRIDQYGQPKFIGAYIYNIDVENGFDLAATITHMTDQQMARYYDHGNSKSHIRRIITIEDHTYTISDQTIQIHNKTWTPTKQLNLSPE